MVFMILFNYLINQILNQREKPSVGTAINGSNDTNVENCENNNEFSSESEQNEIQTPLQSIAQNDWSTPFINFNGINGVFAFFEELVNLFRRADQTYADSRKYETIGDYKQLGKVAVITGGDKDIGAEVASNLSKLGFKVIIGLNEEVVELNAREAANSEKVNQIKALKVDMSSTESIREFAKTVTKLEPKIDLLINANEKYEENLIKIKGGIEKTFAENYLGHFLLTHLLIDNLKKSDNGRIVNVSSIAHYFGAIDFKDINQNFYIPFKAYAQSKLSLVLFTRELSKRLIDTNITAYSVSPEIVRNQSNASNIPQLNDLFSKFSNPVNGSQTLLFVALDESIKNESGFYYTNLKKVHPLMCNASDDTSAEKLWDLSENLVQLEEEYKLKSYKEFDRKITPQNNY